ncbi:MAG: hypothetical protein FWH40_04790 [Coriobacteriia bacterium]|nr:hypothetical protein [Coriobacteriia bacterium]
MPIKDAETRLEALKGLRDKLALCIDASCSGRDIAALAKQLMDCLAQIDELEGLLPEGEVTVVEQVITLHHGGAASARAGTPKGTGPAKGRPGAQGLP